MKKKLVQLLLLCSLFFNIAHATVIAMEEDCHHESEYVLDTHVDDDCGDMCDTHHLFHFMAILDRPSMDLSTYHYKTLLTYTNALYTQNIHKTTIKPPIV